MKGQRLLVRQLHGVVPEIPNGNPGAEGRGMFDRFSIYSARCLPTGGCRPRCQPGYLRAHDFDGTSGLAYNRCPDPLSSWCGRLAGIFVPVVRGKGVSALPSGPVVAFALRHHVP